MCLVFWEIGVFIRKNKFDLEFFSWRFWEEVGKEYEEYILKFLRLKLFLIVLLGKFRIKIKL